MSTGRGRNRQFDFNHSQIQRESDGSLVLTPANYPPTHVLAGTQQKNQEPLITIHVPIPPSFLQSQNQDPFDEVKKTSMKEKINYKHSKPVLKS